MDIKDFIEAMSRDDFFQKIFTKIAQRHDFSTIACGGIESLTIQEKDGLRDEMVECGIPPGIIGSDEELAEAVSVITARGVGIR